MLEQRLSRRWTTVVNDDAVDDGGNVGVNGVNNADGRNDDGDNNVADDNDGDDDGYRW